MNADNQWYWVPDSVNTQPTYSPALVAFIPLTDENSIGWVPLAPGDSYAPVYYDANLQPHYLTQAPVVQQQFINLNAPGAVTVVSADDFGRDINPKTLRKFDRQMLANVRPVLDPLSVGELRQLALQTTNDRRRVDLPPGIAKKLDSTQVFTSATPFAPPFRDDLTKSLRVERVPENTRKQQLQFKDGRQAAQAPVQASAPVPNQKRKEEIDVLAPKAARGDKEARRQLQEIQRQERVEPRAARQPVLIPQQNRGAAQAENQRAARGAEQRAQAERVGLNQRMQREAERQQAVAAQQQQRAAMQQQAEAQRQAQRQAQQQRAQQQQQLRQRVEQQSRPQREVRTPPGQMRQQQAPSAPQGAKPQGQGSQGKGKGKGHP